MEYIRLPYYEYFINTSEDYTHTGKVTRSIDYAAKNYRSGLFKIKHEVNYELHYEPERDVIQVNFQCTHGFTDWVANIFEFAGRYYKALDFEGEPLQLRVHHGWGDMYLAVKHEVREGWKKLHDEHSGARTEIIGWSLGAGIACLCCQDLNFNFGVRSYLYTFGSVRPFKFLPSNRERTLKYLSSIYEECFNFADVNDLISYMPPFRGYTMPRRVTLGGSRKSLLKLLNPIKYHTHYDSKELYQ